MQKTKYDFCHWCRDRGRYPRFFTSDFEEYKETIRRALKTLLSRGYINTGLKIGHKNSYYLSNKGYKETEKAGEKNVQG